MPPQVNYYVLVPDFERIIVMMGSGVFSYDLYDDGYSFIFLFQILTALLLSVCLAARKWEQYFSVIAQMAIIVVTSLVSVVAPIIGVNQYVQTWSYAGGRQLVQFEAGFYLAVVSLVLTLAYAASSFAKLLRE